MNAIVRRYTKGKPVSEKLRILATWTKIEKRYANENDVRGPLPTFGQTALDFIREMEHAGRGSSPARSSPDKSNVKGTTTRHAHSK